MPPTMSSGRGSRITMIRRTFPLQSLPCKLGMLQQGRPTPFLHKFKLLVDFEGRPGSIRAFHPSLYARNPWLAGCDVLDRLFCWPCLLMLAEDSEWNTCGFSSPLYVPCLREHQRTLNHLRATFKLRRMEKEHAMTPGQMPAQVLDVLVSRNCEMLRTVIDAIDFVVLQRRLSCRRTGVVEPIKPEECVQAIGFLSMHGTGGLKDRTVHEDAAFVLRSDPRFLMLIVGAVSNVLKSAVKREVRGTAFASVVQTGHRRDEEGNVLRSTVLRFLTKDGRVRERCIGFHLEGGGHSLKFLGNLLRTVADFQLERGLVSFAVDGLCGFSLTQCLKKEVHPRYPRVVLAPSYLHPFRDVLVQKLSCTNGLTTFEGSAFFATAEAMLSFLKDHRDDACLSSEVEDVAFLTTEESSRSPVVLEWIRSNVRGLVGFFERSVADQSWRGEDLARLNVFREFLTKFETAFWLLYFIRLFHLLRTVHDRLAKSDANSLALAACSLQYDLAAVAAEKDRSLDAFWSDVVIFASTLGIAPDDNPKQSRRAFGFRVREVLTCVEALLSDRLSHLQALPFVKLLSPTTFGSSFTDIVQPMNFLEAKYGSSLFEADRLKVEGRALYGSHNRSLHGSSTEQMLEHMTRYESRRMQYPNMIRLAQLFLALPCARLSSSGDLESRMRAIAPILDLSKSPDFSVLFVESELLEEIRLEEGFHAKVIDVYSQIVQQGLGMIPGRGS